MYTEEMVRHAFWEWCVSDGILQFTTIPLGKSPHAQIIKAAFEAGWAAAIAAEDLRKSG